LFYYGRLRENGDTLWTKGFALPGGSGGYKESFGQKLIQDMAGNLALLGETYYDGRFHATLVRTDSNGKVLSYREYAYKDSIAVDVNKLYTLKATPQNGILMVGVVANQDADPGYWDTTGQYTWIVQTDSLGCLSKDCDKADTIWHPLKVHGATAATFSIYPNPVSNHFTIEGAQGAAISLTNSIGQRAMNFTMTGNKQLVDISALPSGVYILQLTDANGNRGATRILKH
jgi:hypothetical protein